MNLKTINVLFYISFYLGEVFLIEFIPKLAIINIGILIIGFIIKEMRKSKPKTDSGLLKEFWEINKNLLVKPLSDIEKIKKMAFIISTKLVEKHWTIELLALEIGSTFDMTKDCLLGIYSFLDVELDKIEKKMEIDLSEFRILKNYYSSRIKN